MAAVAHWMPIVEGDIRERVHARIAIIVRELSRLTRGGAVTGPHSDHWMPLFFAYAWAAQPTREELEERALALLAGINERLERPMSNMSLWDGLAGIAWLNAHFERVFVDAEEDASNDDLAHQEPLEDAGPALDRVLTQLVRKRPPDDYDLISGLVGIGMLGIERADTTTGTDLVVAVIDELARRRVSDAAGSTLLTAPGLLPPWQREQAPAGYYNLGVAHGVPGVIGFLAHAQAAGCCTDGAAPLLEELVAWVLAQRYRAAPCGGGFANWAIPGHAREAAGGARCAWCYGGLGVGAMLVHAGQLVTNPAWVAEGVDICLAEAAVPIDRSGVVDAGLCHGAAGNAHIFNRLFQTNGDERFRDAALRYYRQILDYADDSRGIAGYVALEALDEDHEQAERPRLGPVDDASLLTGTAGIGLALLASISDVEPQWDRLMLMDIAPPQ